MTQTNRELFYKETLQVLSGLGIESQNHVKMPDGSILTAQEFVNKKLRIAKDLPQPSLDEIKPIGYYNDVHGFLFDESDKDCYCEGGCSMEPVYTKSQLN